MCLAMCTLGVLDPHFDPLGEAWVAVPELWSTARERRSQALSRHTVHRTKLAHLFWF
jgi:hypothetical protein